MIYLQYAGDVHICRKHLEPIFAVFWQSVWGTPIPAQQTQAFCCIKYILSIRQVDVLGMQTYQVCRRIRHVDVLGMQTYQVCRHIRLVVACCRCIKKSRGQRRVLVRWTFFTSFLKQCVTKFSLYFIHFRLFQLRNTSKSLKGSGNFAFKHFLKYVKTLRGWPNCSTVQ